MDDIDFYDLLEDDTAEVQDVESEQSNNNGPKKEEKKKGFFKKFFK